MIISKISPIVDKILLFLTAVFFTIAIAGFFSRDFLFISLVAITCALSVTALVSLKKEKKVSINPKIIHEAMLQFYFKEKAFAFDTIKNALSIRYGVSVDEQYIMLNNLTAVHVCISNTPLCFDRFCTIYRECPMAVKRLVIVTSVGANVDTQKLIAAIMLGIEVEIINGEMLYKMLDRLNALPVIDIRFKAARRTAREFLAYALSPKATRRYLFTALVLIGSSFFMPSSVYFLVFGALCLGLALLSKSNIIKL